MWFGDVDVPDELIHAHRRGELVLFVGAGASMCPPSNLPGFEELARSIATDLQVPFDVGPDGRLDLFLGNLAKSHGSVVHARAAARIGHPASAPSPLHEAVVALATAAMPMRIVTTNYDLHFSTVLARVGQAVEEYVGPALPVGHDFEGLVYLHGRLGGKPTSLILTDADFGRAYLTDSWASRFLERMFATYTVLFIGYSHNDLVMFYLARGLRPSVKPRYVLTDKPEGSNWRMLDIKPIRYPTVRRSHEVAVAALRGWAERANMGLLQHSQLITQLMAEAPSLIPQDMSYMESVIADAATVGLFTDHATSEEWLLWAASRPEVQVLFDSTALHSPISWTLATWFARNYVVVEDLSVVALGVAERAGGTLSPTLWNAIGTELHRQQGPRPAWLTPWVLLLAEQAPIGGRDLLEFALVKTNWSDVRDRALALLIFDNLTQPRVELRRGVMANTPSLQIVVRGSEHWLHEAWTKVFLPNLADSASEIILIAERHIRRSHELTLAQYGAESGFDMMSFRRSAIERHEQDTIRGPIDIVIDAARDCLESLLDGNPAEAQAHLNRWADAKPPLLRRCAVHGWAHRSDIGATAKIAWLGERGWLFDSQLHHEVFQLIALNLAGAEIAEADLLVAQALTGPKADGGPTDEPDRADDGPTDMADHGGDETVRRRDHRIYSVLHWIVEHAPDLESARAGLADLQARNPDFIPDRHPDLASWLEVGFVQPQPPMTVAELHDRIEADAADAISALREYEGEVEPFHGPSWDDAVSVLADTIQAWPQDGFATLATSDVPRDLIAAVVRGWSQATVDDQLAVSIMDHLASSDLESVAREVADLLADGGRDETHPTQWHRIEAARPVAVAAWNALPEVPLPSMDSWLERAINHPAGRIAQFWVRVVEAQWRDAGDTWNGLPAKTKQQLESIIADGASTPEKLAQVILASRLDFFFAADLAWCQATVLPLLDWDRPDRARRAWDGFLTWGRPHDRLLAAGLLSHYLEAAKHRDEFGDQLRHVLAQHLAAVAIYSNVNPMDDGWLSKFTATVDSSGRAEWMQEVARLLAQLKPEAVEDQWERWMRRYWDGRLEGIPAALTHEEASALTRWASRLRDSFAEGVTRATSHPAGVDTYGGLLDDLSQELIAGAPQDVATLLAHVLKGTEPPLYSVSLQTVVSQLKARGVDTRPIAEQALRLGWRDADRW